MGSSSSARSDTPDKSTTVRVRRDPRAPAWIRGGVKVLAAVSSDLAASAVTPLFFRSQRGMRFRDKERALFDRAARLLVPFEGERIAAWSFGQGPRTVVLVHGWNGRASQMAPFIEPLLASGFRVVAFDHLGHGESTGTGTSYPQMAEALRAVVEAAGGAEAVVAHSLGAAASVLALADGLSIARAVLIAPPESPLPWLALFGRALGLDSETLGHARRRIERRAGKRLDELHTPRLVADLSTEALIVHDAGDAEVPLEAGTALHRAWHGSRLEVTEGLGHNRILAAASTLASTVEFLAPTA